MLSAIPDADKARRAGDRISMTQWDCPEAKQKATVVCRVLWAKGGKYPTPLDNGLLGYFAVDLTTLAVSDVNSEMVEGSSLDLARRRLQATGVCRAR